MQKAIAALCVADCYSTYLVPDGRKFCILLKPALCRWFVSADQL